MRGKKLRTTKKAKLNYLCLVHILVIYQRFSKTPQSSNVRVLSVLHCINEQEPIYSSEGRKEE